MSSPEKKKRKKKKPSLTPESTTNPSLSYDLLVSCFSHVSRLYYPTLSLVSKSFRSLINSPELYRTRPSIGCTESCLYVYLRFHPDPTPRWYTLCKKPNPTITNDIYAKEEETVGLCCGSYPISTFSSWTLVSSSVNRFKHVHHWRIHRRRRQQGIVCVSVLDCRSQTWLEGPRMQVERSFPAANVIDGNIYVAGGCKGCESSNWMEVFDPKTRSWELVSCPCPEICGDNNALKSAWIDEKVYIFGKCNGLA